jgi:hypothetical protein
MNRYIFDRASYDDINAVEPPSLPFFLLTATPSSAYCVRKPGSALSFFDVKGNRPDQTMEHIR